MQNKKNATFTVIKYKNLQLYHVKSIKIVFNHNSHTIYKLLREKTLIESNKALSSSPRSQVPFRVLTDGTNRIIIKKV